MRGLFVVMVWGKDESGGGPCSSACLCADRPAQSQEPSQQQQLSQLNLRPPAQVVSVLLPGDRAAGELQTLSEAGSGKP